MSCTNCEFYSYRQDITTFHRNLDETSDEKFLKKTGLAFLCSNPEIIKRIEYPKKMFIGDRNRLSGFVLIGQAFVRCDRAGEL